MRWHHGEHYPAGDLQDQDGDLPEQGHHLQDQRLLHLLGWGGRHEVRLLAEDVKTQWKPDGPVTLIRSKIEIKEKER